MAQGGAESIVAGPGHVRGFKTTPFRLLICQVVGHTRKLARVEWHDGDRILTAEVCPRCGLQVGFTKADAARGGH